MNLFKNIGVVIVRRPLIKLLKNYSCGGKYKLFCNNIVRLFVNNNYSADQNVKVHYFYQGVCYLELAYDRVAHSILFYLVVYVSECGTRRTMDLAVDIRSVSSSL